MSTDDRVYIRFKGRTIGPLGLADAKNLVKRGQITPLHEVSGDGLSWRPAQDHSELFPSVSRAIAANEPVADRNREIIAPAPNNERWHVHVDGSNVGPLEEFQMKQWLASGRIGPSTLVWREGMSDWVELETASPSWIVQQSVKQASQAGAASASGDLEELGYAIKAILRARNWAMFLAVLGICVFAALSALWLALFLMSVATKGAVAGVIVSLASLVFSVAVLVASVFLMHYVGSVGVLRYQPTTMNLQIALNRLGTFWQYTGILMLVAVSATIAFLFLAYLLGLSLAQIFPPK